MLTFRVGAVLAVSIALTGCTTHRSTINSAFDDLVNETRTSNSTFISYKSYVAVSGLIPHSGPGTIFHHPDGLSPTHGLGLSPKWTYIVEAKYPMEGTSSTSGERKVREVRDKYLDAREAIVKATALGVAATLGARVLELARSSKDVQLCGIAARMLEVDRPTKCEDAELNAIEASVRAKAAEASKAAQEAGKKRDALVKAVDQKNLVVTRWDQRTELTWLGKLAEFFAVSVDRKQDRGGVLIAGDLRTITTKVGEDYVDMVREMNPTARVLFQQAGIDLFQIQAKHQYYVADLRLEDAVAATLSLTVEQLRDLSSALGAADRLEIKLGAALLTDISNIGAISSPQYAVRRRCFMPAAENEKAEQAEARLSAGYDTVYQVRGQMATLGALNEIQTDLLRKLSVTNEKNPIKRQKEIDGFTACVDSKVAAS